MQGVITDLAFPASAHYGNFFSLIFGQQEPKLW